MPERVNIPRSVGTCPNCGGAVDMDMELTRFLDRHVNGAEGVTAVSESVQDALRKANGLIAGTQEVQDVNVAGRGSLVAEQDAQQENINSNSGSDLMVMVDKSAVTGSGQGQTDTDQVTVTVTGGVGPYTVLWSRLSGDAVDPIAATGFTTGFRGNVPALGFLVSTQRAVVTDSTAGTPLTGSVTVGASLYDNQDL